MDTTTEQLKSSWPTHDQMDMMMMQLPGAYTVDQEFADLPPPEFSAATSIHFDKPRLEASSSFITKSPSTTNISFTSPIPADLFHDQALLWNSESEKGNSMAAMREMIFRIAAMQPIHIDPESVKAPKRRNVKISKDPQSVAARHRRERISERIRILQRLVPGGTKMDTASMLDEAIHYVKFLKTQVQSLEKAAASRPITAGIGFPCGSGTSTSTFTSSYLPMQIRPYQTPNSHNLHHYGDA